MEAAAPAAARAAPKTGWLIKQSRPSTIRKTWNRRFFVLEWPTLRYYKEEADAAAAGREPKGVLQCDDVTLTDDFPHASERPHVFGVFHQSREPFFLQAATTEEMIGWVNAIRNDDAKVGLIDFDEVKMLGEGAYGSVKLVRHRAKRTLHAMKILNKEEQRKNDAVALTKVERDVLLRVRHPFVVQMAFAFSTQENLYMVMDYVNGGDLYSHMQQQTRFPEAAMRLWAAEISLAVGYLHTVGVVFRDLKPENILLDGDGHAHLTDFGLSCIVETADSRAHSFCGTPYYVSPELIQNCRMDEVNRAGYSKDVDWWALGILCFELLVGDPPFDGQSTQEVYKKICSGDLKLLVRDQLAQKKEWNMWRGGASPEAVSFVCGLLERDLSKRLGAGQGDVQSIRAHRFFAELSWDAVVEKRVKPVYRPAGDGTDESLLTHMSAHYGRKMMQGAGAAEKPKGLFERVRRKSLEMILGENAKPTQAQMAALLAKEEDDEEEEFTHWRFGGDEAARQDGGAIDHSRVRALFDEFDDDSNGYLDADEVRAFSATLGLALSAQEAAEAAAEMEIDTKKDGRVEFDEFMHWFTKKAIGMDAGSVGWRLIEAREQALRDHALDAPEPGTPTPRPAGAEPPEPPMEMVPTASFVVKHAKARVGITVDGAGLHILEKGTKDKPGRTVSFPLGKLSRSVAIGKGKRVVTIDLVGGESDGGSLVFETKEAETVATAVQKAVMARMAWQELQKEPEPEPEPELEPEPEAEIEPEPEPDGGGSGPSEGIPPESSGSAGSAVTEADAPERDDV